jgi:hypothetical protein
MNRAFIVAALAFAAAFGAERLFAGAAQDLARYNRMRKMSDEPPLIHEIFSFLGGAVGNAARNNGATGLIADLTNDVVRYARMKSM